MHERAYAFTVVETACTHAERTAMFYNWIV